MTREEMISVLKRAERAVVIDTSGPIIQTTISGRRRDLLKLTAADCDIYEISWAMAKINRYNGHWPFPYSIATHSVLVSHLCATDPRGGLKHDITEAFGIGDMISPVKRWGGLQGYTWLEENIRRQLTTLGLLSGSESLAVKRADMRAWELECIWMRGRPPHLCAPPSAAEQDLSWLVLREWSWIEAQGLFMNRWDELHGTTD